MRLLFTRSSHWSRCTVIFFIGKRPCSWLRSTPRKKSRPFHANTHSSLNTSNELKLLDLVLTPCRGEWGRALHMYEQGLQSGDLVGTRSSVAEANIQQTEQQEINIKSGIARTVLRNGDFKRCQTLCQEIDDRQLYRDCGAILEGSYLPLGSEHLVSCSSFRHESACRSCGYV